MASSRSSISALPRDVTGWSTGAFGDRTGSGGGGDDDDDDGGGDDGGDDGDDDGDGDDGGGDSGGFSQATSSAVMRARLVLFGQCAGMGAVPRGGGQRRRAAA
jgi:hypothetical protein